jgi:hypothetical protein
MNFRLIGVISLGLTASLLADNISTHTASVLAKEKVHSWQKGALLDVSSRDEPRLIDGTSYERIYWVYTVDDGTYVWKLQRETRRRDKPLDVTINASVQFAIEGQKAFLKDDAGEEHSLSVIAKALKVPK